MELPVVTDTAERPETMTFDVVTCPTTFSFSFSALLSNLKLNTTQTTKDDVMFALEMLVSEVLLVRSWLKPVL